jgi:hypothetical protein
VVASGGRERGVGQRRSAAVLDSAGFAVAGAGSARPAGRWARSRPRRSSAGWSKPRCASARSSGAPRQPPTRAPGPTTDPASRRPRPQLPLHPQCGGERHVVAPRPGDQLHVDGQPLGRAPRCARSPPATRTGCAAWSSSSGRALPGRSSCRGGEPGSGRPGTRRRSYRAAKASMRLRKPSHRRSRRQSSAAATRSPQERHTSIVSSCPPSGWASAPRRVHARRGRTAAAPVETAAHRRMQASPLPLSGRLLGTTRERVAGCRSRARFRRGAAARAGYRPSRKASSVSGAR